MELAREAAIRWTGKPHSLHRRVLCLVALALFQLPSGTRALTWCTDNFGIAFSHLLKQMNVSSSDLREYFGVEETYEDIY